VKNPFLIFFNTARLNTLDIVGKYADVPLTVRYPRKFYRLW
jgi:hypothetical protein